MHNEYDGNTPGVTTDQWVAAVRADAALVRDALGQGAATTPYTFTYVDYPCVAAGSPQAIQAGMNQLSADPGFNARFDSTALNGLAMDGPGEPPGGHIGYWDAYTVAGRLADFMAGTVATWPPPRRAPGRVAGALVLARARARARARDWHGHWHWRHRWRRHGLGLQRRHRQPDLRAPHAELAGGRQNRPVRRTALGCRQSRRAALGRGRPGRAGEGLGRLGMG